MTQAWLADTSVAVPAVLGNHESHAVCAAFVRDERPGLGGHARVETFSVLTRLPVGLRISARDAVDVLRRAFPDAPQASARALRGFLPLLVDHGIVGGAVYDALVALVARDTARALATRDERAAITYEALGVPTRIVR